MTLARKVARLMSGSNHEGSAWLIDAEHALTALHCVQTSDGMLRSELSLVFHGQERPLPVNVIDFEKRIDVALLKLDTSHPQPADYVITLSRGHPKERDDLILHGYPAAAGISSPGGISVSCKVMDPAQPFRGASGKLQFDCIAMYSESTTPVQISGKPGSGLKGASGGAVAWAMPNEAEVAVGLLLEEGLSGSSLYAVSIGEIAKSFPTVAAALERSTHVDPAPRVFLELVQPGYVRWSGTVGPGEVAQLWTIAAETSRPWRLYSAAKLRELGPLAKAFVRLAAYSRVHSLGVPDREAWKGELDALDELHRTPDISLELHGDRPSGPLPAPWQEFRDLDLAELIHCALDKRLLYLLSDEMRACLSTGKYSGIGVKIEKKLRLAMWEIWLKWHVQLEQHSELLRQFLCRVFDVDAEARVSEDSLASIGCCVKLREQLFRATLLAVALGAAGISTNPVLHGIGNLNVTDQTGHACGVETRDQTDLRMFVRWVEWKSDVVFLPYLQSSLLQFYEKSVSFTSADGALDQAMADIPPIALTLEPALLAALARGASELRSLYNALDAKRSKCLATNTLAGRTDKLNG